jgi:hypothetical protein
MSDPAGTSDTLRTLLELLLPVFGYRAAATWQRLKARRDLRCPFCGVPSVRPIAMDGDEDTPTDPSPRRRR